MERAIRLQTGVDTFINDLPVHLSGGKYSNNWSKRVRYEINSHTDIELTESSYSGERVWIEYNYYSQTQAKTRESKKAPSKYAGICEKLEYIMDNYF